MPVTTLELLRKDAEDDRRWVLESHRYRVRTIDAVAPIIFNSPLARLAEASGLKGAIMVDISRWSPNEIWVYTHTFDLEDVLEHLARPIYERFKAGWINQANNLRWKVTAVGEDALRINGLFETETDAGVTKSLFVRVSLKDVQTACKIKSKEQKLRSYDDAVADAISRAARDNTLIVYEVDCEGVEL